MTVPSRIRWRRLGPLGDRLAVWACVAAVLVSLLSLLSYGLGHEAGLAFAGLPRMSPGFADLRQLTHASGCGASFAELLANRVNCDPWSRPFNYTALSLALLRLLGVTAASTPQIGVLIGLLALLVTLVFVGVCVQRRSAACWLAALFIGSFPFQLALERGNYDLLVLAGCLLIPLLLATPLARLTPLLAGAVTALKLFPLVGLAPWSLAVGLGRGAGARRWGLAAALLLATLLGVAVQLGDLPQMLANTPKPTGGTGFGLLASYQSRLGTGAGLLLSVVKLALIAAAVRWCRRRWCSGSKALLQQGEPAQQALLLFGWMLLLVYLLSRSWDYRLIFALGCLPTLVNALSPQAGEPQPGAVPVAAGLVFVGYEQYLGGPVGLACHLIADAVVQPLLVGVLVAVLIPRGWRDSNPRPTV